MSWSKPFRFEVEYTLQLKDSLLKEFRKGYASGESTYTLADELVGLLDSPNVNIVDSEITLFAEDTFEDVLKND